MARRDIAPGLDYGTQIIDAIEACTVLVLVWCGNSIPDTLRAKSPLLVWIAVAAAAFHLFSPTREGQHRVVADLNQIACVAYRTPVQLTAAEPGITVVEHWAQT